MLPDTADITFLATTDIATISLQQTMGEQDESKRLNDSIQTSSYQGNWVWFGKVV